MTRHSAGLEIKVIKFLSRDWLKVLHVFSSCHNVHLIKFYVPLNVLVGWG